MCGELGVAFLSILIGCWTLEQTRQEHNDRGYKVCRAFCPCKQRHFEPPGRPISLH